MRDGLGSGGDSEGFTRSMLHAELGAGSVSELLALRELQLLHLGSSVCRCGV